MQLRGPSLLVSTRMVNLGGLDAGLIRRGAKHHCANLGKDLRNGVITTGLTRKRRNKNAVVAECVLQPNRLNPRSNGQTPYRQYRHDVIYAGNRWWERLFEGYPVWS